MKSLGFLKSLPMSFISAIICHLSAFRFKASFIDSRDLARELVIVLTIGCAISALAEFEDAKMLRNEFEMTENIMYLSFQDKARKN